MAMNENIERIRKIAHGLGVELTPDLEQECLLILQNAGLQAFFFNRSLRFVWNEVTKHLRKVRFSQMLGRMKKE